MLPIIHKTQLPKKALVHQDFLVNESSLIIVSLDVPGVEARWFKEPKRVSALVAKLKKSATNTCIVETSHALFNYFFLGIILLIPK